MSDNTRPGEEDAFHAGPIFIKNTKAYLAQNFPSLPELQALIFCGDI